MRSPSGATVPNAKVTVVKKADIRANPSLGAALDQSFHLLALFGLALLAGS